MSDIIKSALSWVQRFAGGNKALASAKPIDQRKARDILALAGLATLELDIDDGLERNPAKIKPIDVSVVRDIGAALGETPEQIEAHIVELTHTSAGEEIVLKSGAQAFVYDFKNRINTIIALATHGTLYFIHPEDEKNPDLPFQNKRKIAYEGSIIRDVPGDTLLYTKRGQIPVGFAEHLNNTSYFARSFGLFSAYMDPETQGLEQRRNVDKILGTTEAVDLTSPLPPLPGKGNTPAALPPPM